MSAPAITDIREAVETAGGSFFDRERLRAERVRVYGAVYRESGTGRLRFVTSVGHGGHATYTVWAWHPSSPADVQHVGSRGRRVDAFALARGAGGTRA